ncbi:hypothetical protein EKO27_g10064, partial [Xylaria grammica]
YEYAVPAPATPAGRYAERARQRRARRRNRNRDVGAPADSQTGHTTEDRDQDPPTSRHRHDNSRPQKHLVILSEQAIGNTRSVLGAYKLLKAIRALADWAEGDFRAYIDGFVIPGAAKRWTGSSYSASLCSALRELHRTELNESEPGL